MAKKIESESVDGQKSTGKAVRERKLKVVQTALFTISLSHAITSSFIHRQGST
jgi:hypothetical protein